VCIASFRHGAVCGEDDAVHGTEFSQKLKLKLKLGLNFSCSHLLCSGVVFCTYLHNFEANDMLYSVTSIQDIISVNIQDMSSI
jgi:hypothetical protein